MQQNQSIKSANTTQFDEYLNKKKKSDQNLISKVTEYLNEIDSNSMLEDFKEITKTIQEEIQKKFEGSRHEDKVKEILSLNFEVLKGYFCDCMGLYDKNKFEIVENINILIEKQNNELYDSFSSLMSYLHNENIKNQKKDLNLTNLIYDDDIVKVINSLSSGMKDYFKISKNFFFDIKSNSDYISQQVIYIKEHIKKYEKYEKERGFLGMSSFLDKIYDYSISSGRNILLFKNESLKFYDHSKACFKEMKNLRNEKMEKIEENIDDFIKISKDVSNVRYILIIFIL